MKRLFLWTLGIVLVIFIISGGLFYFFQEKLIFQPEKLDKDFSFKFEQPFEEINIPSSDGKNLNGLLFKADSSKGIIFHLHGSGGSVNQADKIAKVFSDLNYDLFAIDYRGYGKSEGEINSQQQLSEDIQTVYDELKKRYSEDKIIVLGFSLGTGIAAKLASNNHPRLLILQAPYYSSKDLRSKRATRFVPSFLYKYNFETNEYLKNCKMPVVVFHGDADEKVYYGSSLKLKKEFKTQDTLIILKGQGHNGMSAHEDYKQSLKSILEK